MFYFVYVLLSEKDQKFYIGFTRDVDRRLREHNSGKSISTAKRMPLRLVYYEAHTSKIDALRREGYFKTTKGKAMLKVTLKEFFKMRNDLINRDCT